MPCSAPVKHHLPCLSHPAVLHEASAYLRAMAVAPPVQGVPPVLARSHQFDDSPGAQGTALGDPCHGNSRDERTSLFDILICSTTGAQSLPGWQLLLDGILIFIMPHGGIIAKGKVLGMIMQ